MKARELLDTLSKVQRKEIGKPSLTPQLEEITHSISHDPIFKDILNQKRIPEKLFEFSIHNSVEKLVTTARMMVELTTSDYQSHCENTLIELCANEGSKFKIILVAKLYIAHIINQGYSRDFIHQKVQEVFYETPIKRCTSGLLKNFFEFFEQNSTQFSVFFSCTSEYAKFMEKQLGFKKSFRVIDIDENIRGTVPENFGEGDRKRIIYLDGILGKDPFATTRAVEKIFSLSRSLLYLHPGNVNTSLDNVAYAVNKKNARTTRINLGDEFNSRRATSGNSENAKSISGLKSYVFLATASSKREDEGKLRVFSSLNSAALAAKTSDSETRLLTIWSAFEALLPEPMRDGEGVVRILYFSDLITPCAVFDYLPRTFEECYRNCSSEFGKNFLDAVSENGIGSTELEKFTSIFVADQRSKDALCSSVSKSPLMLLRFHRLEKLVSDPKVAFQYLSTHERRVEWQIHRIYRERNGIVHKANASPFLNGLVENAYNYYRSVILILEKIHADYKITHPDQGLEMARLLYSEYKASLQNFSEKNKLTTADRNVEFIKRMLSGFPRA